MEKIMLNAEIDSFEEFIDHIKTVFKDFYGEGYTVDIINVIKNNNKHLTGITVLSKESCISPTIYLEPYFEMYQNGTSLVDICRNMITQYETRRTKIDFDVLMLEDFEKVRGKICYKVVNAFRNRELLEGIPHMKFHDLAIVFDIVLEIDGMAGTIKVGNQHMEIWKVSKKELLEAALTNTPRLFAASIVPLISRVKEILKSKGENGEISLGDFPPEKEYQGTPVYICTNEQHMDGAGVILYEGLLKQFADSMGSNLFVLPSSIHECMLVPDNGNMDVGFMRATVKESVVLPEDFLSDNIYYYDRSLNKIEMLSKNTNI